MKLSKYNSQGFRKYWRRVNPGRRISESLAKQKVRGLKDENN